MKKILIVEDTKQLADLYYQALSREFDVKILPNGDNLISIVTDFLPQLIIMDLMLPNDINGYDLIRDLKRNSATRNIPIIIFSSISPDSMPQPDGEENMVLDYLDKSTTTLEQLSAALKHHLR